MKSGSPQTTSWSRALRQADVEPFAGTLELSAVVDDEHHASSLKTFEAQHVAVENLVGVPERIPVGIVAVLLALGLFGMAAAGGEKSDILWPPTLVEQEIDLVVADVQRLIAAYTERT